MHPTRSSAKQELPAKDPRPSLHTLRGGKATGELMYAQRPSLLVVSWIVVGVIVAAIYDYFDSLDTAGRVLTLIAAVLLWPLLLFGFDIRISR